MYLKKTKVKDTDRIYLSVAQGFRDKEKGYSTSRNVKKIGYLDELQKIYDDPIAHFKKEIEKLNEAAKSETAEFTVTAKKSQVLEKNTSNRKNYG